MSETERPRRRRSIINPTKVVNQFRAERGLPKVKNGDRPKRVIVKSEVKEWLALQEVSKLFPDALVDAEFVFTEEMGQTLAKAVEGRVEKIKSGAEALPDLTRDPLVSVPKTRRQRNT